MQEEDAVTHYQGEAYFIILHYILHHQQKSHDNLTDVLPVPEICCSCRDRKTIHTRGACHNINSLRMNS